MIYPANGRGRGSGLFLLLLFPRRFRCRVLVKKHRLMKQDAVDCMDRDDESSIASPPQQGELVVASKICFSLPSDIRLRVLI